MAIDQFVDPHPFVPAAAGASLDAETAEFYNENGFAILRNHIPSDVINRVRPEVEALCTENHRSQKDIHQKSEAVADLLQSEYVHGTIEKFNGPSALLQAFAFTKNPQEVRTKHWHQDGIYWGLSDSRVACVFVPMTATTTDNGCIWFVPGTHKLGRLYHWVAEDEFGLQNLECDISSFKDPVPMLLQPGDAVVAHTNTIHASFNNMTDEPRISLGFHHRNVNTHLKLADPYRKLQAKKLGRDPAQAA